MFETTFHEIKATVHELSDKTWLTHPLTGTFLSNYSALPPIFFPLIPLNHYLFAIISYHEVLICSLVVRVNS